MSNHAYLNLSLHCDTKQGDEVHDQNGPKDGDVKELKESTAESDDSGLGSRVPEFELGQPPDERPKLVILFCGQFEAVVGLFSFQLRQSWVDLWRQEGQKQV